MRTGERLGFGIVVAGVGGLWLEVGKERTSVS